MPWPWPRYKSDSALAEQLNRLRDGLGVVAKAQGKIMIDTSKILAAVTAAKTQIDSLLALSQSQTTTMKDLAAQLASAIAVNDPAAMAQVQADLDKAADELNAETTEMQAAIAAGAPVPATAPASQPAPTTPMASPDTPAT